MFSKVASDLTGGADVCVCVPKEQFSSEQLVQGFLLPGEIPFILLKSGKEEHLFTDMAYITSRGASAASTKRLISRLEYQFHPITAVQFETAGMGITDLDCEIKFTIANSSISIDIQKKETDMAKAYYRCLVALSATMKSNAQLHELMRTEKDAIKISISVPESNVATVMNTAHTEMIALAEAIERRCNPASYRQIFERFL